MLQTSSLAGLVLAAFLVGSAAAGADTQPGVSAPAPCTQADKQQRPRAGYPGKSLHIVRAPKRPATGCTPTEVAAHGARGSRG